MAPGERVGRQPDGLSGRESSPESSCGRGLGHGEQPFRRGPGEQGDRREMTVSCAGVQPARDGSNMRVSMSSLRAPCNPPADRHRSRRWAGHPRALVAPPQCPKIRAIPGPSLAQRAPRNPFSLVNSDADRVPPANEESAGVVLAEEAGLLLDAREEAPDLGFHPSGAFHSARSRPSPACTLTPKLPVLPAAVPLPTSASGPVTDQTPGSALGCVTLADALPLVHGLLDEAVRLLSKAVEELGVVAQENLDALTGAAGAFGRFPSGVEPERDPGVPEIVRSLGQARRPLGTRQGVLPGPCPRDAVGASVHVVASLVPKSRPSGATSNRFTGHAACVRIAAGWERVASRLPRDA